MIVGRDLDLVDTAADFVDDHEAAVREKLEAGQVRAASVEDARRWQDEDAVLWAVVTAPWILVQETQQAES